MVGCCAYIASVLRYLGFERHQPATKHLRHMTKIMDSLINAEAEALDTNRDSPDRSDTERDLIIKIISKDTSGTDRIRTQSLSQTSKRQTDRNISTNIKITGDKLS